MNNKKLFLKNFSYTFISNLLSAGISIILVLIVPKFLDVNDYGMWQLYTFYSQYIAYTSLGITDGIYLRYGGVNFLDLPKSNLRSQFHFLIIFEIILGLSLLFVSKSVSTDLQFVYGMVALVGLLTVPRSLITLTLQATNRMKENAYIVISERVIYFVFVFGMIFLGIYSYKLMIIGDIIGKIISLLFSIFLAPTLVIGKFSNLKITIQEIIINIRIGIKLLIANLSGILVSGIVRFGIERNWGVSVFGKISLTLSISNMVMLFVNSIGLVLFPILRKIPRNKLSQFYNATRAIMMPLLLLLLLAYFPIKIILGAWLPQYDSSLNYVILLLPMVVYESKVSLLSNTILKTIRKERILLFINLITVIASIVITLFTSYIFNNLNMAVFSITMLSIFKSIISEIYISKYINISNNQNSIYEIVLVLVYIFVVWELALVPAILIYLATYLVYIYLNRINIKKAIVYYRSI